LTTPFLFISFDRQNASVFVATAIASLMTQGGEMATASPEENSRMQLGRVEADEECTDRQARGRECGGIPAANPGLNVLSEQLNAAMEATVGPPKTVDDGRSQCGGGRSGESASRGTEKST
jgi:hypothetical protein